MSIKEFNEQIKQNPDRHWVYYERGCEYYQLGKLEKAIKDFNRAIELNLEDGYSHFALGQIYSEMGNPEEALVNYNEAIVECLDFNIDEHAYIARGGCYRDLSRFQDAIEDYDSAIQLNIKCHEAYIGRAYAYISNKQYANSIEDLNKAIELKPNDAEGYFNRGYAFNETMEYKKAIADYTKVIQFDSNNSGAYRNRAMAHDNIGEFDRAIDDYTKAINIEESALLYDCRGKLYIKTLQYDKCIEDNTQVIRLDPSNSRGYTNRGYAKFQKQEFKEALKDFESAILLDPSDSLLFINRGSTYMKMAEYDNAVNDYTKAIELAPDNPNHYHNRSIAYRTKGELLLSLKDANRAIDLDEKDPDLFDNRAIIYWHMAEYQKAICDFEKALRYDSQNPDTYYNLGLLNDILGNLETAVAKYTLAIEYEKGFESAYELRGRDLYKLKKYDVALKDFRKVLSLNSKNLIAKHYIKKLIVKNKYDPLNESNVLAAMDCVNCDNLNPKSNNWGEPKTCALCEARYAAGLHDNPVKCENCSGWFCCNCVITLQFCGKSICTKCADQLEIMSDENLTCPTCRTGLIQKKFIDYVIDGDYNQVKKYIDNGVDPNLKERRCFNQYTVNKSLHMLRTPLYYSVANSHVQITELLIDSNANVTAISSVDPDGEIDLYELAEAKYDTEILTILRYALSIKTLDQNDFVFVVRKKLFKLAKTLLIEKKIDVNLKDDIGDAAIHYAVYNNDFKMFDLLMENGVNLYSPNKNNASILKLAQLHGYKEMWYKILESGFDKDVFDAIEYVENGKYTTED